MLTKSEKDLIKEIKEEYQDNKKIKRMIEILEYEADSKGENDVFFGKQFDRYLNGFCQNMEKAIIYIRDNMHRFLQGKANEFVLKYIRIIGDENNRYDGRNEYTIKQLMKVKKLCEENDIDLF